MANKLGASGLVLAIGYILGGSLLAGDSWTRFQNGGELVFSESKPLSEWSESEGVRWKFTITGYGQSSPVSDGKVIYVTSTSGEMKNKLHVQAIGRDGKPIWRKDFDNASPEKNTTYVSRAAPSPVCDAQGVIAGFEGGNIVALSTKGEVRWEQNLAKLYGPIKARHGLAASLEHDEQHVFVWVEREDDPYVVALSKKDGSVAWKSKGLGVTSWSSPRLLKMEEGHHLVLSGNGEIVGLDPASGKRLWSFNDINGNMTPTPIPVGNARFLTGASPGRGEIGGNAAASNGLVEVKRTATGYKADWVWRAENATSSFGSPLAYKDRAYFVNRSGAVYCLNLKDGKQIYAKRSPESIWATPLAVDNKIFLFGKDGTTSILAAGDKFEILAKNTLFGSKSAPAGGGQPPARGPVLYAGVLTGSDLLIRRGEILYCIGK